MLTLAAYPRRGPYLDALYAALERAGVRVVPGDGSITWLLRHVSEIDWFHFHWPSLHYARRDDLVATAWKLVRFLATLLIIRLAGKRIAWTAHNLMPHDRGRRISVAFDVLVRHAMIGLASVIFVHGPTAARVLAARFPRAGGKTSIIDHGHFIDAYPNVVSRAEARARTGIGEATYLYLFVGLCKPYKNLVGLIDAFGRTEGDATLLICGQFQSEAYLREVRARAAPQDGRIRVLAGRVPDEDLQLYLNACDAVVLPYREILTSGAAMLAISFGRPVVAPRMGYLEDVIGPEYGMLYEPGEPDGLTGALARVRERRFDPAAIRAHARSYDWDEIAGRTRKALEAAQAD